MVCSKRGGRCGSHVGWLSWRDCLGELVVVHPAWPKRVRRRVKRVLVLPLPLGTHGQLNGGWVATVAGVVVGRSEIFGWKDRESLRPYGLETGLSSWPQSFRVQTVRRPYRDRESLHLERWGCRAP